jgi:uncharacterized membrane protein YeaQ/YmgE (transglycosylase-associated protein family)
MPVMCGRAPGSHLALTGWLMLCRITGRRPLRARTTTLKKGKKMHIIWTVIIGLLVGAIARFLHPGGDRMGIIMTIILGIAGSLLATYAGQALGLYHAGEGTGLIGAVIGSVILLILYGMIKKN